MEKLEVLNRNIEVFLTDMMSKDDYNHLNISVNITPDSTLSEEIRINSNAALSVKNSIKATNVISGELRAQLKSLDISTSIVADITFSTKSLEQPVGKVKKNAKDEKTKTSFVCEKPKYRLEDVILPDDTRRELEETIALMSNFDMVYREWNFYSKEPSAKTNICFYGMPGTGKTMCAHGIAQHLNMPILIASYADIQSEYVGVGPKNLRDVFKTAEENNALLFFDEADSFLRKRTSDTSSSAAMHYNSMTNEMMKHLEDFNGIVIFATNLTENTDEAFKTRLASSIEFKAPDEETRARIIKTQIPSEVPLLTPFTDDDYLAFSKECEGFVGRDIRNAIKKILCHGANTGEYPFSFDAFLQGFKDYSTSKNKFDNSVTGKKKDGASPLDIFNANGTIMTLLTYAVWFDGKETDDEAKILRKYAKILSRNKPVITKLSDLPDIEEICDEIKDKKLKLKAMEYLVEVLATSGDDNRNMSLITDAISYFNLEDLYVERFSQYYERCKEINEIKNNLYINN